MAALRCAAILWSLAACEGQDTSSPDFVSVSTSVVQATLGQDEQSVVTTTPATDLVEATDIPSSPDPITPATTGSTPTEVPPELVPFWFFDFGVIGVPGLQVGDRPFYNFVTIGNSGEPPIQLTEITFPELPEGLIVRRVALRSEDKPELAWPNDQYPADTSPVSAVVLEPTNGIVENAFEDPRFFAVYVEVEVVAEGQWIVGPMDVTYAVGGTEITRRVSENVGSACTTPRNVPCIPHLQS